MAPRARRLVEGRDCVEQGYLLLPVAEGHLAGGDTDAAHATAADAAEIGKGFKDADLIACARHLQGRVLIKKEQVPAGLALLDEAMLAVISGELSPIMTGLIYCSLIEACQEVYASRRAREWTDALARWCEQQPQLVAFTGVCLVHRAQIMQLSGAWPDAMVEVHRACERASQRGNREPPPEALYRQAELFRLRGDFAAADEAFRNAGRLGSEPQPGLALLRMAQGRSDAACAGIRRVLCAATNPLHRARFLPAYIHIMLATSGTEEARVGCDELTRIADRFGTDVLQAMAAHARGSVELAEGEPGAALGSLRRAYELWRQVDAPYESACVRMLIGRACRSVGDVEAGEQEFDAARSIFGMAPIPPADLERIDTPTSVIWGRHDLATPLRVAEKTCARYAWPLHVIDGAGDDPPMEQPEAFLKSLHVVLGEFGGDTVAKAPDHDTRAAWDAIAPGYDRTNTPTQMRIADEGLRRAELRPGMRFLDVAAGSGALGIPAARLGAHVLAIDRSPAMLEHLGRRSRDEKLKIETRVMDGHTLELEDNSFDMAGSQFGVMLFPDMPGGIREMTRVVKPGGRVLIHAYGDPHEIEFLGFLVGAVQSVRPEFNGPPMNPPPLEFQLADPGRLRRELCAAGLKDVQVETVVETTEHQTGKDLWEWLVWSNPIAEMMLGGLLELTEDEREVVRRTLEKMVRERAGNGSAARLTNPVHIGFGTK